MSAYWSQYTKATSEFYEEIFIYYYMRQQFLLELPESKALEFYVRRKGVKNEYTNDR